MSSFRNAPQTSFWSIERVVAIFTPLFAAVAGFITSTIAQLVPGVTLNRGDLTALFIAGSTAAAAAALKWLHGRQKIVKFTADIDHVIDEVTHRVLANQVAGPAIGDIESLLKTHREQIVQDLDKVVASHTPKAVSDAVSQVLQRLISQGAGPSSGPAAPAAAGPGAAQGS